MNERDDPAEAYGSVGRHRRGAAEPSVVEAAPSGSTERVRIAGVEATVAAGLAADAARAGEAGEAGDELDDLDEGLEDFPRFEPTADPPGLALVTDEMADWTAPPTGQVPRVLLEGFDGGTADDYTGRGPVWRERDQDWDDEDDLSHLSVEGETLITAGGGSLDDEDPYDFDFGPRRSRAGETEPGPVYGPLPPTPAPEYPPARGEDGELASAEAWDTWTGSASGATEAVSVVPAGRRRGPDIEAARRPPRRHARRGRGSAGAGAAEAAAAAGEAAGEAGEAAVGEVADELGAAAATGPAGVAAGSLAGAALDDPYGNDAGGIDDSGDVIVARRREPAGRGPAARPARPAARRAPARQGPAGGGERAAGRDLTTRIITGLAIAVVGVLCFFAGSVATLVLTALVVTLAAAESLSALQRAGYRPATLLGLLAVPAAVVSAYLKGPSALVAVMAVFVVATILWYLTGITRDDPVLNIGVTTAAVTWIGMLGAFAGLVLSPAAFPDRHGVAFLVGAVMLTVANDIGAFAVGRRLGKHPLLPRVSPRKSWEGALGGTVLTMLVAVVVTSRFHPWDMATAVGLGVLVCVLAPLGDLGESQFKRALGLKDVGTLLPAHGGVLDRIDGMLFVLPATYLLVRALHLG